MENIEGAVERIEGVNGINGSKFFFCKVCSMNFQVNYIEGNSVYEPKESIYRTMYCPYCGNIKKFIIQTVLVP